MPAKAAKRSSHREWRPERAVQQLERLLSKRGKLLESPKRQRRLRIVVRRLEALLLTFRTRLPEPAARDLAAALGELRSAAGEARDAGLAPELLESRLARYPDAARAARRAARRRARDAARLLRDLTARARRDELLDLVDLLVDASIVAPGTPPAEALPRRALAAFVGRLDKALAVETASPEAVHRVRRRFKEIRYAIEALAPLLPAVSPALLSRLDATQKALGTIGDLASICEVLRRSEHGADHGARVELRAARRRAEADLERLARTLHRELHTPRARAMVAELAALGA